MRRGSGPETPGEAEDLPEDMEDQKEKKDDKRSKGKRRHASENWSISGFDGLRKNRTLVFSLDFNIFNDLVETTYRTITSIAPEYSTKVTFGMFSYYCGFALWYRLYAIRYAQGADPTWEFPCLKVNVPRGLTLPKPICELLDSIGDYVEESGVYWKLVFPAVNPRGHFGKMAADTFYNYLAYPAPAILIAALHQEFNVFSGIAEKYSHWRVRSIDFEDFPDQTSFNDNVVGYYVPPLASLFAVEHGDPLLKHLSSFIKELNKNSSEQPWISQELVDYVIDVNNTYSAKKVSMEKYKNESKFGSAVQMGFVKMSDGSKSQTGLASTSEVQAFSPFMLPQEIGKLVPVFRLRIKRPLACSSFPYDFESMDDVPESWPENLNSNFNCGDAPQRWNLDVFTSGFVDRKLVVAEYVNSFYRSDQ